MTKSNDEEKSLEEMILDQLKDNAEYEQWLKNNPVVPPKMDSEAKITTWPVIEMSITMEPRLALPPMQRFPIMPMRISNIKADLKPTRDWEKSDDDEIPEE